MNVQIQSVKFDADRKLVEFVEHKMDKLDRFVERAIGADVILKLDKDHELGNKVATINLHIPGDDLVAESRGKSLNRHNLHPVVVSAAARDTADADTIVVHGRDRPRHMRSMTAILGIRPRYIPLVFGKIIAIDVIDISVTVVIHSLLTVQFRLIDPHIAARSSCLYITPSSMTATMIEGSPVQNSHAGSTLISHPSLIGLTSVSSPVFL